MMRAVRMNIPARTPPTIPPISARDMEFEFETGDADETSVVVIVWVEGIDKEGADVVEEWKSVVGIGLACQLTKTMRRYGSWGGEVRQHNPFNH
jgi:hypothetical protein